MNDHKEQDEKRKGNPERTDDGSQGRASFHQGSTTQGGSNFGQGSHQLAGDSYEQGDEKSKGANYENENDRLAEQPENE